MNLNTVTYIVILAEIERGTRSKPISAREICKRLNGNDYAMGGMSYHIDNLTDVDVRSTVSYARRSGELIGSNGKGYWVCKTIEEAQDTIQSLRARGNDIVKTADQMQSGIISRFGRLALKRGN